MPFRSEIDFQVFEDDIRYNNRHLLNDSQREFVEAVLSTVKRRILVMPKQTILWRAALGHKENDSRLQILMGRVEPHPIDRMKPRRTKAAEGRANPKGIPCLYTADNAKTAIMEVRPWIGSSVTVSQLVLLKKVRLVDCSKDGFPSKRDHSEGNQREWRKAAWWSINQAFSTPISKDDDVAYYAATQVLAEAFRNNGFDGIVYTSRMCEGKNIALFDLDVAEVGSRFLFRIRDLKLSVTTPVETDIDDKYGEMLGPSYLRELRLLSDD